MTNIGQHFAHVAWLPRDFVDPFGRSASVMPWDRETKTHVLDDARAYDAGLSDDAGGGNPLGFASKVHAAPRPDEVAHLDDYIKYTLYGIKTDTAKPPFKSLQVGGDPNYACNHNPAPGKIDTSCDGIRMTMYYYGQTYFEYNYTESGKCGLPFGGPTWCMTEGVANATYRAFNYPHHTSSYWAMYHVARNYNKIKTERTWQWYLWRAAQTSISASHEWPRLYFVPWPDCPRSTKGGNLNNRQKWPERLRVHRPVGGLRLLMGGAAPALCVVVNAGCFEGAGNSATAGLVASSLGVCN